MALKDPDLIKPWIYALIVGLVISIVGIIPLIGVSTVGARWITGLISLLLGGLGKLLGFGVGLGLKPPFNSATAPHQRPWTRSDDLFFRAAGQTRWRN